MKKYIINRKLTSVFIYFFSTLPSELKKQFITDARLKKIISNQMSSNPVDQAMHLYSLSTSGLRNSDTLYLVMQI